MGKITKKYDNFQWIDITKPIQKDINELTKNYHLHRNTLEDTLQHEHLPKYEKLDTYSFIILRAFSAHKEDKLTTVGELTNKIAFFYDDKTLITIHQQDFPFLQKTDTTQTSTEGLILQIFAKMLDTYKAPLNYQSEQMDSFEQDVFLKKGNSITVQDIYYHKSKAQICQKIMQLTQEVLLHLNLEKQHLSNLQDLKETIIEHLVQSEKIVDEAMTLLNVYLSISSQKNNDIMKLLTVFSAFFLPMTFIVGLYGMNFKIIPELDWTYGYPAVWVAMILISVLIFKWFKKKDIL